MHPRIQLIQGGLLISIQFGDAVAICARGRILLQSFCKSTLTTSHGADSEYCTRLELKSSTDRTLGVGVAEDECTLLVLTSATMMKAHVDMDFVAGFSPE
jgi:nuclear pore complex protein Nup133